MHHQPGRLAGKLPQIGHHFLAHGDEGIHRFYKVAGKGFVAGPLLMWNDIVGNAYHAGMFIPLHDAQDGSQAGAHQGQPVPYYDDIGSSFLQFAANQQPVEGIDRIDPCMNVDVCRSRFVGVLRFARKQKAGVLQGKRIDGHRVSFLLKLYGQPFVECAQATAERVRRSDDDDAVAPRPPGGGVGRFHA